jgi:hypothetical protein
MLPATMISLIGIGFEYVQYKRFAYDKETNIRNLRNQNLGA